MRICLCIAFAGCFVASPTAAQRAPAPPLSPEEVQNRDMYTVAVGAAIVPDYEGSDDYRIFPAPAIRARIHGVSITTNGPWVYVDVIPKRENFSFDTGPIVGLRFDRRHHSDDALVKLLPNRNTAIEFGAFLGVSFRGLVDPYDSLAIHLDVLHDIGNAHKSTIISPNISFSTPLSLKTYVSLNAAADFVGSGYGRYYFGVTPADSELTGGALQPFTPGGGLKSCNVSFLLNQSITGDLVHGTSIFGLTEYSRLLGDFSRSPLVAQQGNANQLLAAVGVAYTW